MSRWEPVEAEPEDGVLVRWTDGTRVVDIVPLTYGRARLHVGPAGSPFYDDGW